MREHEQIDRERGQADERDERSDARSGGVPAEAIEQATANADEPTDGVAIRPDPADPMPPVR